MSHNEFFYGVSSLSSIQLVFERKQKISQKENFTISDLIDKQYGQMFLKGQVSINYLKWAYLIHFAQKPIVSKFFKKPGQTTNSGPKHKIIFYLVQVYTNRGFDIFVSSAVNFEISSFILVII